MKKFLVLVTVLSLIVSTIFVVPAFAESYWNVLDYRDYVTNVEVDAEYERFTVYLPYEYASMFIDYEGEAYRLPFSYTFKEGRTYWIDTYLFGSPDFSYPCAMLDLSNVPAGTQLEVSYQLSVDGGANNWINWVNIQYYDTDLNVVYTDPDVTMGSENWGKTSFTYTIKEGYAGLGIWIFSDDFTVDADQAVDFFVEYIKLVVPISTFATIVDNSNKQTELAIQNQFY